MTPRIALACCALLCACKGKREDEREPAQAPVAPPAPADAASPDAAVARCFDIPFDASAEQAGIRRLAHRASQASAPARRPRDIVVVEPGTPTLVRDVRPAKHEPALKVALPGAEALVTMAKIDRGKVTVTAPAHLEGAVVSIEGDTGARLAIGDAGLATFVRYRNEYVKPRLAKSPYDGSSKISDLYAEAIIHDDIDGDGTPELIAFSWLGYDQSGGAGGGAMMMRANELEIGILWSDGTFAFGNLCCADTATLDAYLVPPDLSGGTPQLFASHGDRFAIKGKTLEKVKRARTPSKASDPGTPPEMPPTMPPAMPRAAAPKPKCLQTSATEPAELVEKS